MRSIRRGEDRERGRTSVWHRLSAVVLVPALGLLAVTADIGHDRWTEAQRARQVQTVIDETNALLRAKLLLTAETFATGSAATARRFGLEPAALVAVLGYDPEERLRDDREALDDLLADHPDVDVLSEGQQVLPKLRTDFDLGAVELPDLLRRFSQFHESVSVAADDALFDADEVATDVTRSSRLREATTVLRAAVDAATSVGMQLDALAQLFTPETPARPQDALAQLRAAVALESGAASTLWRETDGALRAQWSSASYHPEAVAFRGAARRYASVASSELPAMPLDEMIALFAEGMTSIDLHDDGVDLATAAAVEAADELHHLAVKELRAGVVGIAATLLASLLVTFAISRSIGRPLRRLASKAAQVTGGDLAVADFVDGGPRELVAVGSTLGELSSNLRVVESQLGALAAGNLDDPVLDVPVPGRLGTLLHESVGRLSRSIGEREVLGRRLEHDATHDALTGLTIRSSFLDAVRLALVEPVGGVAVLKVDLDGFKAVNEAHGHDTGDRLLRIVAERLRADIGADGLVARIGGDEFGVVVTGEAADTPCFLADRLLAHVGTPVRIGAVVLQVRASVGVAVAEEDVDPDALVRHAGLAARAAKARGGGVERFDGAMLAEVERRADVERRLRAAMGAGELVLHFQPVVDLDLRPVGAEALIRWRQADGSLVPPGEFIPVAEGSDLIVELGRWVLHEACATLAAWRDDPVLGGLSVSVNLSGRHVMSMTVVDDVQAAVALYGIDPSRLGVEVTETVLLTDLDRIIEHLERLRSTGVAIEIDDFGTGYTSLAHLRRLPVDVLKVDRSLVVAAAEKPADAKVLELVVGAAHALGLTVVGEGVETAAQMACLRAAGCDLVQGFLVARPVPAEDLATLLGRSAAVPASSAS